jgi:hypothetical protein
MIQTMKTSHLIRSLLIAAALLAPGLAFADGDDATNLNHFSFSGRVGFGVNARFKSLGNITGVTSGIYSNGYVLTDISQNAGGQTWNWGYDSLAQSNGNTILMSRYSPAADASTSASSGNTDPNYGFELTYDRQLGASGNWHYGVESAVNYMRVFLNDSSSFSGNVQETTDAYPFTPGTTPPLPPYQGTYQGPGFLLNSTPVSSTTTIVPGTASITGTRQFSSDIIGFRLGPYGEYALTDTLDLSLSAGLAAGLLYNSASWNETIAIPGAPAATSIGSGHNFGFVVGGYANADISWRFFRGWTAEGGVQFQDLGKYDHDVGSREVELDLSKSIFFTIGVGCKF